MTPDESERALQKKDKLGHVANDVIDASVGAVAGGALGILAGPVGMVAGAAVGAIAGGLLGHQADNERHEREDRTSEIDDISVEGEFFGAKKGVGISSSPPPPEGEHSFEALAVLAREHREMERVALAFEAWATRLKPDAAEDPRPQCARFVDFFRAFVADVHHAKEEGILFEVLDRTGFSRQSGPISVMAHEHNVLDGILLEIEELAKGGWGAAELPRLQERVQTYADVLRRHIQKEETVLYPMAEARMSPPSKREVDVRCATFTEQNEEAAQLARSLARELVTPSRA
ncbi:MAG: hemerythrin domain-containing protein [Polyangiaceae bacterium]|nr:hemerythrin domain-containing protein [Polyangiaceae bacterium]